DESFGRAELQLPDEADDDEREDHRQVEDALIDARAPDVAVQEHRKEDADGCGDERQPGEPDEVVAEGAPELEIPSAQEESIVAEADEVAGGDVAAAVPVREGVVDRGQRGPPDEHHVQQQRNANHRYEEAPVIAREDVVATTFCGNELP